MRKGRRYSHKNCAGTWEPIPLEAGHYRCSDCGMGGYRAGLGITPFPRQELPPLVLDGLRASVREQKPSSLSALAAAIGVQLGALRKAAGGDRVCVETFERIVSFVASGQAPLEKAKP